uniref:protein-disulfide reductase n=1 Tax=Populus alba TaxID=43335 RepID=A0A4V6A3T4_POPAL|nr:putative nucleoredoxin 1 isoform X1 [Populus alba]
MATEDVSLDLSTLLSSEERDFLIRNNGDQVKVSNLVGKIVGFYFSGSWCGPCRNFTPLLVEVYEQLSSKGDFEVVFISSDRDDESFNTYFSEMPWLAIPFSDTETRKRLKEVFKVRGIPNLVIFDANGKIPVLDLEGKLVGLYFSIHAHRMCREFTPKLVELHKRLKEKGENFEVVLISLDFEEKNFKESFETMPWLALPFKDKSCKKLARYFELRTIPNLVIIGQDGKTLNPNVVELIEDHGIEAYPFTPEKLDELAAIEKAKLESQTLESVLVNGENDFVIDKSGSKVRVSDLVGKNILLYFSAQWCPPCRAFLPKLIEAYHTIKGKGNAFEVIFISSDSDQSTFDEFYSEMPWLALPFGDERKQILSRKFKIKGIPAAVAIGPSGRTITKEARMHLTAYGADAFPFTEEHLKQLEEEIEEKAKGWPEKVKHELHTEHELIRAKRKAYICKGCRETGYSWSFYCKQCDFDLHPKCALKEDEDTGSEKGKEGRICDGDVCRRA